MARLATLGAILILIGIADPTHAIQVELPAIQDAYTSSANPSQNHGNDNDLHLGTGYFWGLGHWRGYIQFDLSTVQGTVDHAELHLYQYATSPAAGGRQCDLHRVLVTWDEAAITWANQASHAPEVIDSQDVGDSTVQWHVWDVTSLVQEWMFGVWPNLGMVLKTWPEANVGAARYGIFYSSEYTGEPFRPKLVLSVSQSTAVEATSWGRIKALY